MEHFIRVAVVDNAMEAQVLSSFLDQYEIPHRLQSYHDTAYDGLFQLQKGWGAIHAPAEFRQQILDALADLRARGLDPQNE